MGVPCLSAYLKVKGWDVGVYDLNIECYANRQKKYINHWEHSFQEFWNDANAVSGFYSDHAEQLQKTFDLIKEENPAYIGFST